MRTLALDVGDKRIGLALSDPLKLTAAPFEVLERRKLEDDLNVLYAIARNQEVDEVVVGHPVSLDGERHAAAEKVEQFAAALRRRIEVPVVLWDERFSTAEAERALLEGNVSRAGRRQLRDSVAAALILQSYLDHRSSQP